MAQFSYKGRNSKGELVSGKIDLRDKNSVVSQLRTKNIYPISITEVLNKEESSAIRNLKSIPYKDLVVFCKQFHTMIVSGLTVIGCIDLLKRQSQNKTLTYILNKVYNDLQKGLGLSEALNIHSKYIPIIMISMIEVGEVSGNIDNALERLSIHFAKESKIKQKILTAMMYPLVIGAISMVMVFFMLVFVVPKFIGIFDNMGMELPLPTRILKFVSEFVRSYKFFVAIPVVIGSYKYIFTKIRRSRRVKKYLGMYMIKMPMIGSNYVKILASRFSRTLSILLKTGIPLIQALEVIEKVVDNVLISKGIENVIEEVRNGSTLAEPLDKIKIFPLMVIQMISVGEESGSLDSIVETIADFYDDEVDTAINKIISMLEPLMIFFLAIIIGAIVISMIYPMFKMYQGMG
ncbi:MAG: type II secretion system F family protein [Clostridiales bacterium]